MVYNAMKLFMEINPQLFDDCSHEYTEQQNTAAAREAHRERRWAAVADLANKRKSNGSASLPGPSAARTAANGLARLDEVDAAEDNQRKMDNLKLQDGGDRRERRPTLHERQNSVGSSRSGR